MLPSKMIELRNEYDRLVSRQYQDLQDQEAAAAAFAAANAPVVSSPESSATVQKTPGAHKSPAHHAVLFEELGVTRQQRSSSKSEERMADSSSSALQDSWANDKALLLHKLVAEREKSSRLQENLLDYERKYNMGLMGGDHHYNCLADAWIRSQTRRRT